MTCIIGLINNKGVYIGADKSRSTSVFIHNTLIEKVFRKDEYVIAYTESFRMGQLLQHSIKLPEPPKKMTIAFMVYEFVEIVREGFKEYGYSRISSNEESAGSFIVGVNNSLFHIESDYQVDYLTDGFIADGSGSQYALGAMEALKDVYPESRIAQSIKIAAKFCPSVTAEHSIIKV